MSRARGHEHIRLGIVQRHEIMLISQSERSAPNGKRVSGVRGHRDRTLLWMMGEDSSQQAPEHGLLIILSRARVDGK